ncbi:MAG: ABC transporter permease subunit [Eubacteriales bacterium]|nr:ABC transporter permease subunit [Eubacteriales bacterium]
MQKTGLRYELRKNRWLYLMALPGILFILLFNYAPLAGLYFAFVDYNAISGFFGFGSKFVGLNNFEFFFTSEDWLPVTFNTLYLNTLFISTGLFMQVAMAVLLNELSIRPLQKISQSLMFLPNFLSWTVVSIFALAFLGTNDGILNKLILLLGGNKVRFYQDAAAWPGILVFLRLWKGVGYGTVIFLAAITGIDQNMYEAAKIDGASRWQCICRLTLPMLRPTVVMMLILSVGSIFNGDFGMIYALVGDNAMLRSTTDVIDTYVYRALRTNNDIGMSAAVGLFQSVLGLAMVLVTNTAARRLDKETALF